MITQCLRERQQAQNIGPQDLKTKLVNALARLASRTCQQRYVAGGTAEEYVLPEELLEDLLGLVSLAKQPENSVPFTAAQMLSLDTLARFIKEDSGEKLCSFPPEDLADFILNRAPWSNLRAMASLALVEFG